MLAPTMYPVTSKLIRINFPWGGRKKRKDEKERKKEKSNKVMKEKKSTSVKEEKKIRKIINKRKMDKYFTL